MSTKPRSRSRKTQPLATIITALADYHAVDHWIADLRRALGDAKTAPNAARRAAAFQNIWAGHAEAQRRLDAVKSPGIVRRVAELQRQLDAMHFDATVAAFEASQQRGGVVVDLAAARARRASAATA